MRPPKLNTVDKPREFGKPNDYALAFQTGKGHNDALLQRMILGRHLRKENALYCIYDEHRSTINFKKPEGWPPSRRIPTPPDAHLYWPHLESEDWGRTKVGSYWFWGFMRNTKRIVEVAEQKKIDWFFIDHAYLYHQRHSMFEKYGDIRNCLFRVCKNNYVINKITDTNDHRLLDLKAKFAKDDELDILPWKKGGKHIVVFPPSWWLCKNLGMRAEDVLQDTIDELKKHTDREIRVRVKKIGGNYNPVPLQKDLKDCHAVVSYQSSAAAKAIIKGIPSFTITDKYSAAIPMSQTDLSKIETPIYPDNRFEWLCNLANHQFYANEIQSGYAKRYLDEQDT
jgi:hypothetical protein